LDSLQRCGHGIGIGPDRSRRHTPDTQSGVSDCPAPTPCTEFQSSNSDTALPQNPRARYGGSDEIDDRARIASTGEAEISLFHKLSAGNGRNRSSSRLARGHAPQLGACVVPVTGQFTVEDVLLPGSGFCALTVYVPALAAFPAASIALAELNVVVIALPFSSIVRAAHKFVTGYGQRKFPVLVVVGLIPVITGVDSIASRCSCRSL